MRDFSSYHFKEIQYEERIITVIHRHWFNILQQFLALGVLLVVLVAGFFISPSLEMFSENKDYYPLFLFAENTLFIFVVLYAAFIWIDYYFDVWVITDKRIVNIEQKGLFARQVSELKMERIQDVTTEVKGIIPTMLNYGDVYIQTAATTERFIFRMVPSPYAIKDLIMHLQEKVKNTETDELGEMIGREIHKNGN